MEEEDDEYCKDSLLSCAGSRSGGLLGEPEGGGGRTGYGDANKDGDGAGDGINGGSS